MADQPLIDISPDNWQVVRDILQRYVPDREIWAFGSRAKWTAKEFSDLDVAIIGDEPMSISLMADLREAFQESALPFKIDIVDWAATTTAFKNVIQRDMVFLCAKKNEHSTWQSFRLGDLFDLTNGYAFKGSDFLSRGTPVIKIRNVKPNQLQLDDLAYVDSSFERERADKVIRRGDILITMSGNRLGGSKETWVGKVAYFDMAGTYMLNQRVGILRPKQGVSINPKFCSYCLSSDDYQKFFISVATSSGGQANLSPMQILGEKISLPPLYVQNAIAETLSALDEKITQLRSTNISLEAIAQALFKSWFVDFDPVRAKSEGREPEGVPPEIAGLFPSEFEDSELGETPLGWQIGALKDYCVLNPESWSGKNHPTTVSYIDLANVKENRIEEVVEYFFDAAPSRARRVLRDNDTIVGTVRPGNRSYAFIKNALENLTGSTGFAVLRPQCEDYSEFVYLGATNPESISRLANLADGGAYPAVRPEVVQQLDIVKPPPKLIAGFHDLVAPLMATVSENMSEAASLSALRDSLLPKLMSGVIQVEAANS